MNPLFLRKIQFRKFRGGGCGGSEFGGQKFCELCVSFAAFCSWEMTNEDVPQLWSVEPVFGHPLGATATWIRQKIVGNSKCIYSLVAGGNLGPAASSRPPPGNRSCAFRCSAHVCVFCALCLRRYKEVCKVLSVSNTMFAVYAVPVLDNQCVSLCVLDNQSGLSAGPLSFWGI